MKNYSFGNYICELREKKGLSQSQLGERLGVTNKAVSRWENGSAYPSTELMLPLAKGYKLGGFLAYIASGVLTLIFVGVIPHVILPYAMFFGLHPLVNQLQKQFKINVVLATVIKAIWFIATLYVIYFATTILLVQL